MRVTVPVHLALTVTALILSACTAENTGIAQSNPTPETPPQFDAALAAKLGADDYGMRSYIFATLKTGPNDAAITDKDRRAELFSGHFSNMGDMAEAGQLVLAGPFVEAGEKRGLFILNVATIEEAQALVQSDPAIASGVFTVEFYKYYGSAALMQIQDIHKTIQKTDF